MSFILRLQPLICWLLLATAGLDALQTPPRWKKDHPQTALRPATAGITSLQICDNKFLQAWLLIGCLILRVCDRPPWRAFWSPGLVYFPSRHAVLILTPRAIIDIAD